LDLETLEDERFVGLYLSYFYLFTHTEFLQFNVKVLNGEKNGFRRKAPL